MAGGTRSYEMARRMAAAGHAVEMITTARQRRRGDGRGWRTTVEDGVRVHWLTVPYSNRMGFLRRLWAFAVFACRAARKAASLQADVVFATSTPLTIALPGVWASKRLSAPMVFEVRDLWPELPIAVGALRSPLLKRLARRLESWAYRHAAHIVALSPGMKEGVVRTGFPATRVTVIPNSCDVDLFAPAAGAPAAGAPAHAAPLFDWLGSSRFVLYAGSFGRINGAGYLVRLAAEARKLDPDLKFLMIGEGREFEQVVALAQESGVWRETLWARPSMPKRDLAAVLCRATAACSLFIDLPAMWANSANKFFDALAAGRPVVINYGGWQAELLERTGAGIVIPADRPAEAARRLCALLGDDARLRRASSAASELARGEFNRDALAARLIEVIEHVATGRKETV